VNFFTSTNGLSHINIEFTGFNPVVPKTWSHHLIRFDATTGMVEYLVDGNSEKIVYVTPAGREGGEVYTPITGNGGIFLLGDHFTGMMDELKIHSVFAGRSSIQKYPSAGGRAETKAIDLGYNNSAVIKVDVSGGRTRISNTSINNTSITNAGNRGIGTFNEFRENGRFLFSDDSELSFFIRASNNPHHLNENKWIAFTPGIEINGNVQGRYVQLAVDFYPSADGYTSPYLDIVNIICQPNEPPLPPRNLIAVAVDGGVLLRWIHSVDSNTAGYLVYYSAVRGELFGNDAALGPSPINAGNRNSLFIDGLKNGTLYYFRVAAYDNSDDSININSAAFNIGEFSREVTARPISGLSANELFQEGLISITLEGR
jgi:hypothetical protein